MEGETSNRNKGFAVPQVIRAKKPKGTMVKVIHGDYYVYDYTSVKEKIDCSDGSVKYKTKTKMGKCIGKITLNDGYIPNNNRLSNDEITMKSYGEYAFATDKSQNTLNTLKKYFNVIDALQIYIVALIFVVDGFCYMKNIKLKYDLSYLSVKYPNQKLGEDALRALYTNLGSKQTRIKLLEQDRITSSSGKVAIDGHVIACNSDLNDLSEFGYKAKKLGSEQINWMTVYDVETEESLVGEIYNGADPDKVSVKFIFERFQFNNTLFLIDRGFNTDPIKKLMSKNRNRYIVPMISGRNDYKAVLNSLKFDKRRYFVYQKKGYASTVYYQEFKQENGVRYIAFLDTTRATEERNQYAENIANGKAGYTEEGLIENDKLFGLFLLETNDQALTPEEVYYEYKKRWKIETFYNYIKNKCDFNSLYQKDFFNIQGLSFIVTIAGMIYDEIKKSVKPSKIGVQDVFNTLGIVKISNESNKWVVRSNIKKVRTLCSKLSYTIPDYVS